MIYILFLFLATTFAVPDVCLLLDGSLNQTGALSSVVVSVSTKPPGGVPAYAVRGEDQAFVLHDSFAGGWLDEELVVAGLAPSAADPTGLTLAFDAFRDLSGAGTSDRFVLARTTYLLTTPRNGFWLSFSTEAQQSETELMLCVAAAASPEQFKCGGVLLDAYLPSQAWRRFALVLDVARGAAELYATGPSPPATPIIRLNMSAGMVLDALKQADEPLTFGDATTSGDLTGVVFVDDVVAHRDALLPVWSVLAQPAFACDASGGPPLSGNPTAAPSAAPTPSTTTVTTTMTTTTSSPSPSSTTTSSPPSVTSREPSSSLLLYIIVAAAALLLCAALLACLGVVVRRRCRRDPWRRSSAVRNHASPQRRRRADSKRTSAALAPPHGFASGFGSRAATRPGSATHAPAVGGAAVAAAAPPPAAAFDSLASSSGSSLTAMSLVSGLRARNSTISSASILRRGGANDIYAIIRLPPSTPPSLRPRPHPNYDSPFVNMQDYDSIGMPLN